MPITTFLGLEDGIEEELGWIIKKMRKYCQTDNPIVEASTRLRMILGKTIAGRPGDPISR
jgi:hypothetical protein